MTASIRANLAVTKGLNDGISLMNVAEGGLSSINDILQRARTLAVQAANDTFSSSDRDSLNNEFRQLRQEIDRIATSTEIFGKHPLAAALGRPENFGTTQSIKTVVGASGAAPVTRSSQVDTVGFIPMGSRNIRITVDGLPGAEDDIQLFSRDGTHLVGTPVTGPDPDYVWTANGVNSAADLEQALLTEAAGFLPGATYNGAPLLNIDYNPAQSYSNDIANGTTLNYNGMAITYTGDGDRYSSDTYTDGFTIISPTPNDGSTDAAHGIERLHIDEATEDLFLAVVGTGVYEISATWDYLPELGSTAADTVTSSDTSLVTSAGYGSSGDQLTLKATPADSETLGLNAVNLGSSENAGKALRSLDAALETVSTYRSQYGALMNRADTAVSNLSQERINLLAAQSRIQDADYAAEVAKMTRANIVQEAGRTVMAQANQLPSTVLTLLR